MDTFNLVLSLLVLAAQAYPQITPAISDLIKSFKPGNVDITQEEFERRIDEAIAKLPQWE